LGAEPWSAHDIVARGPHPSEREGFWCLLVRQDAEKRRLRSDLGVILWIGDDSLQAGSSIEITGPFDDQILG
jgi:hypothetical protein